MDKPPALFPWVEANQGLLTLMALALTLLAFVVENRRANRAEQYSRAEARRQEIRALERIADEAAANVRQQREALDKRIHDYVEAVTVIVRLVQAVLELASSRVSEDGVFFEAPRELSSIALGAAESLTAILLSSPLDPELITFTQQAIGLSRQLGSSFPLPMAEASRWIATGREGLEKALDGLSDRAQTLTTR